MKKKLGIRARKRLAKMRRDPDGRFALEVGRYLESKGWYVLMTTGASVYGSLKHGEYELRVGVTGCPPKPLSEDQS